MQRWRTPILIVVGIALIGVGGWLMGKRSASAPAANESVDSSAELSNENMDISIDANEDSQTVPVTVSLLVNYGDGRTAVYSDVNAETPTPVGAIQSASKDTDHPFTLTMNGSTVTDLGGVKPTKDRAWVLWINNEPVTDLAGFELVDGDVLTLQFVAT